MGNKDYPGGRKVMTRAGKLTTPRLRAIRLARQRDTTGQIAARIRDLVMEGFCPYCDEGPFTILAGHTSKSHGVDRRMLRDDAGLTYSAPIASPEERTRRQEIARANWKGQLKGPTGTTHQLSEAAKKLNGEKIRKVRATYPKEDLARAISESWQRRTAERDAEWVAAWRAGKMFGDIVKDAGVTPGCVRKALQRAGVWTDGEARARYEAELRTSRYPHSWKNQNRR